MGCRARASGGAGRLQRARRKSEHGAADWGAAREMARALGSGGEVAHQLMEQRLHLQPRRRRHVVLEAHARAGRRGGRAAQRVLPLEQRVQEAEPQPLHLAGGR